MHLFLVAHIVGIGLPEHLRHRAVFGQFFLMQSYEIFQDFKHESQGPFFSFLLPVLIVNLDEPVHEFYCFDGNAAVELRSRRRLRALALTEQ